MRRPSWRSWVCGLASLAVVATSTSAGAQLLPPAEDSPTSPPKPEPPAAWPWGLRRASTFEWLDLGVRGSLLHVEGVGGAHTTSGLMASYDHLIEGNLGIFDLKMQFAGALGGGGGGVEGDYSIDMLAGVRGYFTGRQGPFARAGFLLDGLGNNVLNLSYGAAAGEAGYQYIAPGLSLETGALGAYVPAGNFGTADGGRRDLGESPLVGAFAWTRVWPMILRMEWRRFLPTDGGTYLPVDVVRASGCVDILRGLPLCLDVESISGGARTSSGAPLAATTASYAGLSVGIGGSATRFVSDRN
jgi:hypothetical protein